MTEFMLHKNWVHISWWGHLQKKCQQSVHNKTLKLIVLILHVQNSSIFYYYFYQNRLEGDVGRGIHYYTESENLYKPFL